MRKWIRTLLVGAAVLAPLAGYAAIDSTHHDMTMMVTTQDEKCAYCHSIQLPSYTMGSQDFGTVGDFCVIVCHKGEGTVFSAANNGVNPTGPRTFSGTVGAWTYSTATQDPSVIDLTINHSADPVALETLGDADSGDGATMVSDTGWPHSSESTMQCTTCHAVHDNTNPPFLNAPLSTGTNSTSFCQRCHKGEGFVTDGQAGRFSDASGTNGAHPSEIAYNTGSSNRSLWSAPLPTNMIEVPTGALNIKASDWVVGGHIISTSTGLPVASGAGMLGCYSCHTPHQRQDASPNSSLLLGTDMKDYCYACHGGGEETVSGSPATSKENPGTTREYHPVNSESPSGNMPGMAASLTADYKNASTAALAVIYTGLTNSPNCYSCHDVHGGIAGKMALRTFGSAVETTYCDECHGEINGHHISNTTTNYTVAADGGYAPPPWAFDGGDAAGEAGALLDGLQCSDCHGGNNGTAHNW